MEVIIRSKEEIRQRLNNLANRLDFGWDFNVPVHVKALPYQDTRSRLQNNLYWKWLTILSDEFSKGEHSYSKEDMHDLMRHKFLGTEEVQIGNDVVTRLPSTARMQRGAMAAYMQRIEAWAVNMGVLLPIPIDNEYVAYREAMQ
jgi:hypothetical protein